jgi:hypothetical protein
MNQADYDRYVPAPQDQEDAKKMMPLEWALDLYCYLPPDSIS